MFNGPRLKLKDVLIVIVAMPLFIVAVHVTLKALGILIRFLISY